MPAPKPKPTETHHAYNISKLNRVFAISGFVLLVCMVLMIWFDWSWEKLPLLGTQADRQWKLYQIQFNELEARKAEQDRRDAEIRAHLKGLDQAAAAVEAAETSLAARQQKLKAAEQSLAAANAALFIATRDYQDAKALLDQHKSEYEIELEVHHRDVEAPSAKAAAQRLLAQQQLVDALLLKMQEAEARQKEAVAARDAEIGEVKHLTRNIERLRADLDGINKKLALLKDPVAQKALAAPIIEFAASPLKYNQIITEKHKVSVNFALVPRVDRCTTCHVGADKQAAFFTVDSLEHIGGTLVEFNASNAAPLIDLAQRHAEALKAEPAGDAREHARRAPHPAAVSYSDIRGFIDAAAKPEHRIDEIAARKYPVLTKTEFEQLQNLLKAQDIAVLDHYAALPQPFKTHPRLDLFVGADSPHPMEKFGCSVCHHGSDRDMNFSLVSHTPDEHEKRGYLFDSQFKRWIEAGSYLAAPDEKSERKQMTQREAWDKNYKWHFDRFNEWPMRPMKFIESSCLKCHVGQTDVAQARKLTRGLRLIEQLGCWSCHKMRQVESFATHKVAPGEDVEAVAKLYSVDVEPLRAANNLAPDAPLKAGKEIVVPIRTLQRPGPSLHKVASKVSKEWLRKWLENPQEFRGDAMMPRFWGHGNTGTNSVYVDPYLKDKSGAPVVIKTTDRNAVEMAAITDYLFALSEKPAFPPPPVAGDAERGRALVTQLGCLACHTVGEPRRAAAKVEKPVASDDEEEDEEAEEKAREEQLRNAALAQRLHDLPEDFQRFRSQGPMLFGAGSKTSPNWLFAWLKNPKAYHPKTRMPNLRLSDAEAADVAAYLASLRNEHTDKKSLPELKSEVVQSVTVEYLETAMTRADADRRFRENRYEDLILDYFAEGDTAKYLKNPALLDARAKQISDDETAAQALARKAADELDDTLAAKAKTALADAATANQHLETIRAQLTAARAQIDALPPEAKRNVYLGGKLIARYGCFACHNIKGFDAAKPIGTELSDWGSKEIARLDFGLLSPQEVPRTRYGFITQKMHDPRSYDAGRFATVENPFVATRAPQEWLKMPKFPLNEEQIEAIATAVNGMTAEPVGPDEVRQLTAQETDIERGRWMVKELNCYGCHLIEGRGWGIRTAGVTVETLRRHSASWSDWAKESVVTPGMEPPMLSGALPTQLRQGARTQPDWLFSFLKAPPTGLVRPWLKARMPTFDLTDAEANVLVRYFAAEAREEFPYKTAHAEPSPEMLAAGKQFFDNLQCFKCHIVEGRAFGKPLAEIPAAQLPQLAPDLRLARARLQRDWLIEQWLPNPGAQVPGTRMPVFEYGASLKESAPPLLGDDRQKQIEALVDYILSLGAQPAQPAPAPEAKATPAAVK